MLSLRLTKASDPLLGLEVAVDDPLAVHVLDRAEDLSGVESSGGEVERAELLPR